MIDLLEAYKGKKVFLTGHTGFKGSWMCLVLTLAGAEVTGYSLEVPTAPSLFELLGIKNIIHNSIIGDIRDITKLEKAVLKAKPEIIIHMAAQPLVRESYDNPVYTYETNVMGTVNILETARKCESVKSIVNVTTDKVYKNNEWIWGYRENEPLNGYDPYSNSKSCSELVTSSYKNSFFNEKGIPVSTCRAGNVIGGGDFAKDRIIPDCLRAIENNTEIIVRNPNSTRPYQHVLEPVCAYLYLALLQIENPNLASEYNIGPDDIDCVTTSELVDMFCKSWGDGIEWNSISENNARHEANFLKLDCSKIKQAILWEPRWHVSDAIENITEWNKTYRERGNLRSVMEEQILTYLNK
ncbi:MAG: CDP-glucose 4,6-dehydratase [Streptococcaceae bacterium]|jgi:CDP-glucose 4,6-dehydratase|nr:CDP-glucose 4,6-dehydratase [Streptococcaceae bacterium]